MSGQALNLVAEITARIDLGRLNPGDALDEEALAAEFGIAATLAEALDDLAADTALSNALGARLVENHIFMKRAEVTKGRNMIEAAVAANLTGVVGECGGWLSGATCHVRADPDWAAAAGRPEKFEDAIRGWTCPVKLRPSPWQGDVSAMSGPIPKARSVIRRKAPCSITSHRVGHRAMWRADRSITQLSVTARNQCAPDG